MTAFLVLLVIFGAVVALSGWAYHSLCPKEKRSLGDFAFRWVVTLVAAAFCGIPTWLFLAAKHLLNPDGFWERFAVYGAGAVILGGIQFFTFIFFLILVWFAWENK